MWCTALWTVELFGGGSAGRNSIGISLRNCYIWVGRVVTAKAVCGLRGLIKEAILALEKVRPEAACITCCLEGIIERPK
jgi:hypothetical protein